MVFRTTFLGNGDFSIFYVMYEGFSYICSMIKSAVDIENQEILAKSK